MKRILLCSALLSLAACGGSGNESSSSSSSSGSSSSSTSSSSSSASSSSSGGGNGGSLPASVTNTAWQLRYLDTPLGIRRASTVSMTLRFNETNGIEGTTACGRFSASYWARHNAMGFAEAPSVPLNCAPNTGSLLEKDYYAALNNIANFSVDGAKLILTTSDNTTLVYEPSGVKCTSPISIGGEPRADQQAPWQPVQLVLQTAHPIAQLTQSLETDYADLELLPSESCGIDELAVAVNRLTLEYLRCRSDLTTITYR